MPKYCPTLFGRTVYTYERMSLHHRLPVEERVHETDEHTKPESVAVHALPLQ